MTKKTFSFEGYYSFNGTIIYEYLNIIVHNSLVDLYSQYFIDDFNVNFDNKKVYINTFSKQYPIDFVQRFESTLYNNGFNNWQDNMIDLCFLENDIRKQKIIDLRAKINKFLYSDNIDTYDFINIDML